MKLFIFINIIALIILMPNIKMNSKFISVFLFMIFVVWFEALYAPWVKQKYDTNHIPYCYFALICAISYLAFYIFKHPLKKNQILILSACIISTMLILYLQYGNNGFVYLSKVYLVLLTVAIFLGIRYLKLRLNEDLYGNNLFWDPYIYLTFGLLIFFATSFPLLLFLETLIASGELLKTYSSILKIGNIFLSLGYLGAAICIRKEAQSTI